jgi:drug/metabolite transporter (DMT)-like permease
MVIVFVPLAATRRLKSPRGVIRPMLIAGVAEVAAFGAYIAASDRIGVAVPAVIVSQFALIAAVVGWFALGERLGPRQIAGAGVILAGVTALTILQA